MMMMMSLPTAHPVLFPALVLLPETQQQQQTKKKKKKEQAEAAAALRAAAREATRSAREALDAATAASHREAFLEGQASGFPVASPSPA